MPRIDYDRLLQSVSIENVAERLGMDLKQATATQSKALCPFHDDKTPSLLIDASRDRGRQHYYCFACGAHGDVIDLVKRQLNLGFKEAVDWLDPVSPNIPRRKHPPTAVRENRSASTGNLGLKLGLALYRTGSSKTEFDAWMSERHLDPAVLLRAGYMYSSQNFLSRTLDGETDPSVRREHAGELEDAHLVRKLVPGVAAELHLPLTMGRGATNRYSDFFIGDRVIFPIYDHRKNLVGLGGRAIQKFSTANLPKYQFTRGFPKATVLYRAEYAFELIRSQAKAGKKSVYLYLCEGFLDALRFEALGMAGVAVMGSTLSEHQVRLLIALSDSLPKDTTLTVVVSFDRDEAGLRGAADACLKLMRAPIECAFLWPTARQLGDAGCKPTEAKDPNDYLQLFRCEEACELVAHATYPPELAVLANAFGISADDTLSDDFWISAPRARRFRSFNRALTQLRKALGNNAEIVLGKRRQSTPSALTSRALAEWIAFVNESTADKHRSYSEEFLNNAEARLNHSRILAYMGSRRGELPCDEPRWERLDIAATAFNTLLTDRLASSQTQGPIGPYDAVWVPRSFGGSEHRLKMMPRAEDLIIQQYLLNEILTERWDHHTFTASPFSQVIPAVRYYREDRRTVTTGFDIKGDGNWGELTSRTLSFAYQIDMDVLEGRQPATDQGMYRPYHECWRDFMNSLTKQATEIGYVYSIRLDVKRYYDRLRRYIVRDRLLAKIQAAIATVTGDTPKFAELLHFEGSRANAAIKASTILDRLDEHLFGVTYARPDTGLAEETNALLGIPQGPVLSAWIGSIALFPVDEVASQLMDRMNGESTRVGYARYVDDIVLLADDPKTLEEMRDAIDRCASSLRLSLLAKADEIPAMSAEDFSDYVNQGRALVASGPAWEPPLVGDGESGWEFWSVPPTTNRQSALQLLHNVELYKASKFALLETVKTAFQAPDLRASELSKAARLIWYSLAVEHHDNPQLIDIDSLWAQYLDVWNGCMQGAAWSLQPEKNEWESPLLFALEGLEHLIDKEDRDIAELSAEENVVRRRRTAWLATKVLTKHFDSVFLTSTPGPKHQLAARLSLVRWKAMRASGEKIYSASRLYVERSKLVQTWQPFEWMHEAVSLLADPVHNEEDPLAPFVEPTREQTRTKSMYGLAASLFKALLPDDARLTTPPFSEGSSEIDSIPRRVALQTLVSVVSKELLPIYLNRRQHLIWTAPNAGLPNRVTLPPLPGISISRLYSCLCEHPDELGFATARTIEAIDFLPGTGPSTLPVILGSRGGVSPQQLTLDWLSKSVTGTNDELVRQEGQLTKDNYLYLRDQVNFLNNDLTPNSLKQAAKLFRTIAQIVTTYAQQNEDKELIPAWPYIAATADKDIHYLIGDGISREQVGNRAFVRDGGRALRTIEVPIYEAHLWRVGVAVSDYLGLHDDVAKFNSSESDLTLDATALANPARYVLRSQFRKLRGAYADSQISKRREDGSILPAAVERTLHLLETFPETSVESPLSPLLHVLATEAESAGMYLAFRERWKCSDVAAFLIALTAKVLGRLPRSVAETLAANNSEDQKLRRDLAGLLCFTRTLFNIQTNAAITTLPAWRALTAGVVSSGIFVAIEGLVASMRSHGSFERYTDFDFPSDWEISPLAERTDQDENVSRVADPTRERVKFIDHLRRLIQHLGHRLSQDDENQDRLSADLYSRLRDVAQTFARIDGHIADSESPLEWPFEVLSNDCLDLLTPDLLETTANLVRLIDEELNFEVVLVIENSFGYNAQTRRFTDSRSGVRDVTPWMISQFPRNSKHIEEISSLERFHRVWSEVFDRKSGTLLSVSALGEPFASIAIKKLKSDRSTATKCVDGPEERTIYPDSQTHEVTLQKFNKNGHLQDPSVAGPRDPTEDAFLPIKRISDVAPSTSHATLPKPAQNRQENGGITALESGLQNQANAFRKQQFAKWSQRGEGKSEGHIRVALLQADFDITYKHPFVEVCPTNWPFSANGKEVISTHVASSAALSSTYGPILDAVKGSNTPHLWTGVDNKAVALPSWSEHRRQAILKRVIDSCQEFGVDLLVLPEYSVRRETINWLKGYLAHKTVSVLAGTYMNLQKGNSIDYLAAPLTLLWPLPKTVSQIFLSSLKKRKLGDSKDYDALDRGHVFEFSRNKKYRSIALEEFFKPATSSLGPLFKQVDLAKALERDLGFEASADVVSHLLAGTRMPLKHMLELICSEIFLISSPANYGHMTSDLEAMSRRFGNVTHPEEVFSDVKHLSGHLSITGDGIAARRSILAVPAATSRSADYWIAGQAVFLAAGTATVFCNSIDGKSLVGGSCFVGCGSWKSDDSEVGYISKVTPYHGWSKGIYYNNKNDTLSKRDQAVVIADLDPHNMLEGKPRAQTMPSPLQLVAYLPLVESVDWTTTEPNLLRALSASKVDIGSSTDGVASRPQDETKFWKGVLQVRDAADVPDLSRLWEMFPDKAALVSRAKAYHNNGDIQPTAPSASKGLLSTPALYDWIDVSLTLTNQQELPTIEVPPWKFIKS